jgi:hypothetical protein
MHAPASRAVAQRFLSATNGQTLRLSGWHTDCSIRPRRLFMLAASPLLITNHELFPILLCWLLGASTIAGLCVYNRSRSRRHDTHV